MSQKRPKKVTQKMLDSQINSAWRTHGDRLEIPMMDILKIFSSARAAHADGLCAEARVKEIADTYRSGGNPWQV